MGNSPNESTYQSSNASVRTTPAESPVCFNKSTYQGRNRRAEPIAGSSAVRIRHFTILTLCAPCRFLPFSSLAAPPAWPFNHFRGNTGFTISLFRSSAMAVLPFSDFTHQSDFTVLPTLPIFAPHKGFLISPRLADLCQPSTHQSSNRPTDTPGNQ